MLKNCLKYFDEILNLAKNLVTLNNLFINYYLKSSNPNSEAKKLIGSLSILTDEVSKHDILQDIESLKKLDKDGTINEEKAKNSAGSSTTCTSRPFWRCSSPSCGSSARTSKAS